MHDKMSTSTGGHFFFFFAGFWKMTPNRNSETLMTPLILDVYHRGSTLPIATTRPYSIDTSISGILFFVPDLPRRFLYIRRHGQVGCSDTAKTMKTTRSSTHLPSLQFSREPRKPKNLRLRHAASRRWPEIPVFMDSAGCVIVSSPRTILRGLCRIAVIGRLGNSVLPS